jgi:Emfourin
MKINIERSGGFAGMVKTMTVDTDDLPKGIASSVEGCFSRLIKTDSMPKNMRRGGLPADTYSYKIISVSGKGKQEIRFNELDIDQELKLAVNFLFQKYK